MGPSILQSAAWQKFQHDLGETTFFEQNQDFQYLAIKKSTPVGPYLYLPCGPYIATKNASKTAFKALQALAEREGAIFIRIEPKTPEIASEWLKTAKKTKDLNPKETWILDITPKIDLLYQNMKQNTRNLCKNYSKKGLVVEKYTAKNPEKLKILVNFQQKVAKYHKINTFSEKYLETEFQQPFSTLYVAYYDPALDPSPEKIQNSKFPIAASLFFDDTTTRYYMQSASDYNFRKLPATYAIINEAIEDAQSKNLKNLDFWGIAPENAGKDHPWAGFTDFKKSFGGTAVTYAGTYDYILNKPKYRLYQHLRKLNRLKRRILH